jgi:fatty acid desaturase
MSLPGTAPICEELEEARVHSMRRAAYPVVVILLGLAELGLWAALTRRNYIAAVPLTLVLAHLMHGVIIGFHEACHGLLRKNRLLNELNGIVIGIFSLTSFSLFRAAHQTHHAYLATPRDVEMWPFTLTSKPRWFRVVVAFTELFAGLVYTPLLLLRTFLRADSPIRSRKVRRRIWAELAFVAGVWATILTVVASLGAWRYLLWMYLAPAWLAASLHGWRKYIEHVGLTGATVRGITRSIVAEDPWGRLVAFTLLHEPFHGVHHQRIGLPHSELPDHAAELVPATAEEHPPYRSYGHAFRHLLGCLADPKVGPQWRAHDAVRLANGDARGRRAEFVEGDHSTRTGPR